MNVSPNDQTQDDFEPDKELQKYHQRDLMPSHVYRVGMKIFGKKPPIRRRIINCSLSWKDDMSKNSKITENKLSHKTIKFPPNNSGTTSDYDQYRALINDRRQMRQTLDSIRAHEQWLSSKDCTPIEAKLLKKLREEREEQRRAKLKPPPTPSESSDSDEDELTPEELKQLKFKERHQLLKEIRRLKKLLKICRTRIAELVVPYDTQKCYLIPGELLYDFLERVLPPNISQKATIILCEALEKKTGKESYIDYRKLFNDNLEDLVLKYLREKDVQILFKNESVMSLNDKTSSESQDTIEHNTSSSNSIIKPFSTMDGEKGEWAIEVKVTAQKQFETLIEYCLQHDIILNKKLAEKALLTPPDKTRQQCLEHIRQPGTGLISRKMIDPPKDDRIIHDKRIDYIYGWQYQQVRGPFKPKLMRLSTGTVKVKAKTDNWLTYNEFEELTKELQSRPGFNYKYHGLPPNSAFWPGALQDKLRLYLPKETLKTKPYSLYNIFQPVDVPKISKHTSHLPNVIWPENDSGHVQLGSSLARTRKTYIA